MQCDFLGYGGGWLGSYKCEKTGESLDKATVNMYCDNSLNYRDCPIFKKTPSGGCYLTTLTCEMLDLPDDDHCLETMRWYRDNVMMNLEHGPEILKDYNKVGPQIAEYIRDDENAVLISGVCRECYIIPTVGLIDEGKRLQEKGEKTSAEKAFYTAMKPYIQMTQGLMEYYGMDPNELEAPVYDKGIARVRKPINNKKDSE